MRYQRHGPFVWGTPLSAAFMNGVESFLAALPIERPYRPFGPFVNGAPPGISGDVLNAIEDALAQVGSEQPYQRHGPFGYVFTMTPAFLNGLEDFLVSLGDVEVRHDLTPLQPIGASEPIGWMDRQGNFVRNPEYIEPRAVPERVQHERMLIEYDYRRP